MVYETATPISPPKFFFSWMNSGRSCKTKVPSNQTTEISPKIRKFIELETVDSEPEDLSLFTI